MQVPQPAFSATTRRTAVAATDNHIYIGNKACRQPDTDPDHEKYVCTYRRPVSGLDTLVMEAVLHFGKEVHRYRERRGSGQEGQRG